MFSKKKEITMDLGQLEYLIKRWTWTENEDLTLPEAKDMLEAIISHFVPDDVNYTKASVMLKRWRKEAAEDKK